ncbi:unnamed protein product, partial [Amoebophrya sp. A25]
SARASVASTGSRSANKEEEGGFSCPVVPVARPSGASSADTGTGLTWKKTLTTAHPAKSNRTSAGGGVLGGRGGSYAGAGGSGGNVHQSRDDVEKRLRHRMKKMMNLASFEPGAIAAATVGFNQIMGKTIAHGVSPRTSMLAAAAGP